MAVSMALAAAMVAVVAEDVEAAVAAHVVSTMTPEVVIILEVACLALGTMAAAGGAVVQFLEVAGVLVVFLVRAFLEALVETLAVAVAVGPAAVKSPV